MKFYAVLVEPWATYVKGWSFFCSQGGNKKRWGRRWRKVLARGYNDARSRAEKKARLDRTGHD